MTAKFKHYLLEIKQLDNKTNIRMEMFTPIFTTKSLPLTVELLKRNLPGVLETKCFNDEKLPFTEEVKQTEIAHLFEHILLQHMFEMKLALGEKSYVINGVTTWNWKKDKRGTFHIDLDSGREDSEIFLKALEKSNALMEIILNTSTTPFFA